MNICSLCPELTPNKDNWCEECTVKENQSKFEEKMRQLRTNLKNLTQYKYDPNWEDFSHPYEGS